MKECLNALWKASRKGLLDEKTLLKKAELLFKLSKVNVKMEKEEGLVLDALKLSLEEGISVYDPLYIVLAEKRKLPLVTLDSVQAERAKERGIKVIFPPLER